MAKPGRKLKIITFQEAEGFEERWRTIYDATVMLEKIIISFMGDFDEIELHSLSIIQQNLSNAKDVALKRWSRFNKCISDSPQ